MADDQLGKVLREFDALRDPEADPELEALKTALMLEDVFGVRLSDADINPALLDATVIESRLRGLGAR